MTGRISRSTRVMPAAPGHQRSLGQAHRGPRAPPRGRSPAAPPRPPAPAFSARVALRARPVRIRSRAVARPDQPRQPLRAARAGDDPSFTSGRPSDGLGMVGGHAIAAGQRRLQPPPMQEPWMAATTGTRSAASWSRIACPWRAQRLALQRAADGDEVLDVGAGDEVVGLAAAQDDRRARPSAPRCRAAASAAPASSPCPACSPSRRARPG